MCVYVGLKEREKVRGEGQQEVVEVGCRRRASTTVEAGRRMIGCLIVGDEVICLDFGSKVNNFQVVGVSLEFWLNFCNMIG